jgi:diguanylate cyclase (GGDEF)-like protein
VSHHSAVRQLAGASVVRYAVIVFLVTAALIVSVAVTLDQNVRRSNWQEHSTVLAGGARVGASAFGTLRADLRVQASQLATSLELQRAVVTNDEAALQRIVGQRRARIQLRGRTIGALAAGPRIASTATISDGRRVLATVTMALPIGKDVLTLLRQAAPLPEHAALVLVRDGRVVAGGPIGAPARVQDDRVVLGGESFAAHGADLGAAGITVLAVEPVAAIDALSDRYRRFVFLAAAVTLLLAAILAARLARPMAQVIGDVARLTRLAQTDALTGLANRRVLGARLEDEVARAARNGTSISFVIADIDDFKEINDGHGHQAGDEVLRAVSHTLGKSVREIDLAARYGGEEFVLVLPGSGLQDAKRTADRIRRAVAELLIPTEGGKTMRVTASFGVAAFPTYPTADALLAAADAALYQAKRSGKNQVAAATVQGDDEPDEVLPPATSEPAHAV